MQTGSAIASNSADTADEARTSFLQQSHLSPPTGDPNVNELACDGDVDARECLRWLPMADAGCDEEAESSTRVSQE